MGLLDLSCIILVFIGSSGFILAFLDIMALFGLFVYLFLAWDSFLYMIRGMACCSRIDVEA